MLPIAVADADWVGNTTQYAPIMVVSCQRGSPQMACAPSLSGAITDWLATARFATDCAFGGSWDESCLLYCAVSSKLSPSATYAAADITSGHVSPMAWSQFCKNVLGEVAWAAARLIAAIMVGNAIGSWLSCDSWCCVIAYKLSGDGSRWLVVASAL